MPTEKSGFLINFVIITNRQNHINNFYQSNTSLNFIILNSILYIQSSINILFMSENQTYQADINIIGGGIAGIVAALELLDQNVRINLFERDEPSSFGGLARWSFGGIFFVDSKHQRKNGIQDSVELAKQDWYNFAEFGRGDAWPKKWADYYIENCTEDVYEWLKSKKLGFFPVVHWVERGLYQPGNSVPRFHMVWGTGFELVKVLMKRLEFHPKRNNLSIFFRHKVEKFIVEKGTVTGVAGKDEEIEKDFKAKATINIVATGGISGNIEEVKKHWDKKLGEPPAKILNGSHQYSDGLLIKAAEKIKANVTHLEKMWNYAAGIHHPTPDKPDHGLSLVPPKSAIWVDHKGKRFGPEPLVSGYDTRFLVEQVCKQKGAENKYSWQVMNKRIAVKELAISGSEFNDAVKKKQFLRFVSTVYFGNKRLIKNLTKNCQDFIVANSLEELVNKMNELTGENKVDLQLLRESIERYDAQIDRGEKFYNDDQLRRIAHLRQYRGDRLRVCNFQKINDKKAFPLVAIREHILSRKSLGGIQTDLEGRVLTNPENGNVPIPGLFAIGESAGFGGGGIHGLRSLEGTFLGGCIFTARKLAAAIKKGV